jgi:hypothetical protein
LLDPAGKQNGGTAMVAGPEKEDESGRVFAKGEVRGKMRARQAGPPEGVFHQFIEGEKNECPPQAERSHPSEEKQDRFWERLAGRTK